MPHSGIVLVLEGSSRRAILALFSFSESLRLPQSSRASAARLLALAVSAFPARELPNWPRARSGLARCSLVARFRPRSRDPLEKNSRKEGKTRAKSADGLLDVVVRALIVTRPTGDLTPRRFINKWRNGERRPRRRPRRLRRRVAGRADSETGPGPRSKGPGLFPIQMNSLAP